MMPDSAAMREAIQENRPDHSGSLVSGAAALQDDLSR
jgi:hypothetical protein